MIHSSMRGSYGMGIDPPGEFDALSPHEQAALLFWIRHAMKPAVTFGRDSSYGLKHLFEDATGLYFSNGSFKGAMLAAGHNPKDRLQRNWTFDSRPRHRRRVESSCYMERTGYALSPRELDELRCLVAGDQEAA